MLPGGGIGGSVGAGVGDGAEPAVGEAPGVPEGVSWWPGTSTMIGVLVADGLPDGTNVGICAVPVGGAKRPSGSA